MPVTGHGAEDESQILEPVPERPERLLQIGARVGEPGQRHRDGQIADAALHPATVREAAGHFVLRRGTAEDEAAAGVHDEQLARTQATALHHVGRIEIRHARL